MNKLIVASNLNKISLKKLFCMGYDIINFKSNPNVDDKIAYHTDISFFVYKKDIFIAKEMDELESVFVSHGFNVHIEPEYLGSKYPDDVKLNCVAFGDYLLCNESTVSENILKFFKSSGKTIINVNQGYTKCSVIPVSDNAIITDDESIGKMCENYGVDVLQVSKGAVALEGYDYGFIGGASGVLGNVIVFNGDIDLHPDGKKIKEFIYKYKKTYTNLKPGKLEDIGSIIFLTEE